MQVAACEGSVWLFSHVSTLVNALVNTRKPAQVAGDVPTASTSEVLVLVEHEMAFAAAEAFCSSMLMAAWRGWRP